MDDETPPVDDDSDEEPEESPFKKQDSIKHFVFDFDEARKHGKMQRRHSETSIMGWTKLKNQSISSKSSYDATAKSVENKSDRSANHKASREIASLLSASTPELDNGRTRKMKRRGSTSSMRSYSSSHSSSCWKALLANYSSSSSTYRSYGQPHDESSGDSSPRR